MTCIGRLETVYRILGTEAEAGIDYNILFQGCKATHLKASLFDVDNAGGEVCTDDLAVYSCRDTGRAAVPFWRLMLLVQMQGTLSGGRSTCCLPYSYDNRKEPPERVRFTAWSLTKHGQETLAVLVGAFRAYPTILTRLMPQDAREDDRVGLGYAATSEQRLRAVFSLGCTLVDHRELSDAQLLPLWNAILALCNGGKFSRQQVGCEYNC